MITIILLLLFKSKGGFIDRFLLWALFDLVIELILCLIIAGLWSGGR
jgi:hypothetical protein